MLLGFLADAHGNDIGFSTCLEDIYRKGVDRIFFLGDAVGYCPEGLKIVQKLFNHSIPCIKGNHEAMFLGELPLDKKKDEVYRIKSIRELDEHVIRIIAEWPYMMEFDLGESKLLMVHGRPFDRLNGYFYEDEIPLSGELDGFEVVVTGHTHRPYIKYKNNILCINAGSCGLPRDYGNLASYATYDTISRIGKIYRVPLDIDRILEYYGSDIAPDIINVFSNRR